MSYRRDPSVYLRRGDRERRVARIRAALLAAGTIAAIAIAVAIRFPGTASAESEADAVKGELALVNSQLTRFQRVFGFSNRYGVPAGLASEIYDAALAAGIDPDLGFRLVKIESDFNERAVSPVGAVGLTQVMPGTAAELEPGTTRDDLLKRQVNLRIGFRYLRGLIAQYKGNVGTALLVYNRGPIAVQAAKSRGEDPSNGYERVVMRGYTGKGTIE